LLCAVTVLVVHSFAVAPLATTGFFQLPWWYCVLPRQTDLYLTFHPAGVWILWLDCSNQWVFPAAMVIVCITSPGRPVFDIITCRGVDFLARLWQPLGLPSCHGDTVQYPTRQTCTWHYTLHCCEFCSWTVNGCYYYI
jgi:hypothetical protein